MQVISNTKSNVPAGRVTLAGGIKKYRMHTGNYDRNVIPYTYFNSLPPTTVLQEARAHWQTMHPREKLKMLSIYEQSQEAKGCVTANPSFGKVLPLLTEVDRLHNPTMKTADENFTRGFINRAQELMKQAGAASPYNNPATGPMFRTLMAQQAKPLPPPPSQAEQLHNAMSAVGASARQSGVGASAHALLPNGTVTRADWRSYVPRLQGVASSVANKGAIPQKLSIPPMQGGPASGLHGKQLTGI